MDVCITTGQTPLPSETVNEIRESPTGREALTMREVFMFLAIIVMALLILLPVFSLSVSAAEPKIRLSFPDAPNLVCGVAEVNSIIDTYPGDRGQREYIRRLFDEIYPEIVRIYGEPIASHPGILTVSIYYMPGSDGEGPLGDMGRYLTHKSDSIANRLILTTLIGGLMSPALIPAFNACGLLAEIPDHSMLLGSLPNMDTADPNRNADNREFDHLFTHELIHAFHDRMDYLEWYSHSWVEEGMTEAAAELVADRMKRHKRRDMRTVHPDYEGPFLNRAPWDNLKHYDMWNYPLNGAWHGREIGFSALSGPQNFWGGVTPTPRGDDVHFFNPTVIPPHIRYAAAASMWWMLAQACSADQDAPDFLKRFNHELFLSGVTKASKSKILEIVEELSGEATIDGLPPRAWLERQALLKKRPPDGGLFIHVENPENFQRGDRGVGIRVYAVYPVTLDNPGGLLKGLNTAELPVRGCTVKLRITDAAGRIWMKDAVLYEDKPGEYLAEDEFGDPIKIKHPDTGVTTYLPDGGYVIEAAAGDCQRIEAAWFESVTFAGRATTYALSTRKKIDCPSEWRCGDDNRVLGATLIPNAPGGVLADFAQVVGARTNAWVAPPNFEPLEIEDGSGFFNVRHHGQRKPFEAVIGQGLQEDGTRHRRTYFQPFPYARVVWSGNSPDFTLKAPGALTLESGKSMTAVIQLIPNGVTRRIIPPFPVLLSTDAAIPGIKVEIEDKFTHRNIAVNAPLATPVNLRIEAGAEARPGIHVIKIFADGLGDYSGIGHYVTIRLYIARRFNIALRAVQLGGGSPVSISVPISATVSGVKDVLNTPGALTQLEGYPVQLEAPKTVSLGGATLDFVEWEMNENPNQRVATNPLRETIVADVTFTARYLKPTNVSLTLDAIIGIGTAVGNIEAPIGYSWTTRLGATAKTEVTRFNILPPRGVSVTLQAPSLVRNGDKFYEFVAWDINAATVTTPTLVYKAEGNANIFARYRHSPSAYEGSLIRTDCQMIEGWARDRNHPGARLEIDVYVGGVRLGKYVANQYRADLVGAGIGDGFYSFGLPLPDFYKDGQSYSVLMNIADTSTRIGSVRTITCRPNNGVFVSQTVPSSMKAGQKYLLTIRLKNVGSVSWTAGQGYRLGSTHPPDNLTWGMSRVELPFDLNNRMSRVVVHPGGDVTFSFNATAPSTPGVYGFQWRMLREGVEWFGEATPYLAVTVTP